MSTSRYNQGEREQWEKTSNPEGDWTPLEGTESEIEHEATIIIKKLKATREETVIEPAALARAKFFRSFISADPGEHVLLNDPYDLSHLDAVESEEAGHREEPPQLRKI